MSGYKIIVQIKKRKTRKFRKDTHGREVNSYY